MLYGVAAVAVVCVAVYWLCVLRIAGSRHILCLMYHRLCADDQYEALSGPERVFTIPVGRFEWQIKRLRDSGYAFVGPQQVRDFAAGESSLDQPAVMITFDDGCRSVGELGAPVLKRFGACATLFVTTDENAEVFAATPNDPRMSDEQIADLDGGCVQIESHAVSHRPLSGLDHGEMRSELSQSRAHLEKLLNREVRYFAVPGNWYDQSTLHAAREAGYHAVWCSKPGVVTVGMNAYPFPRVNIDGDVSDRGFLRQISPGGIVRRKIVFAAKQLPGRILGPKIWSPLRRMLLSCMPGGYLSMRRVMLIAAALLLIFLTVLFSILAR